MGSITGANAVVMLSIFGIFPIPQQIQGFAADDVFDTDAINSAEVVMGVDGKLSAGFVYVPVVQNYSVQADSPSTVIFDTWWAVQQQARETFRATGIITLTAINKKWTLTNGVMTTFKPIPDTKKLLQPQRFAITWESMFPAPV